MQGTPLENKNLKTSNKMQIITGIFTVAVITIVGCLLVLCFATNPKEVSAPTLKLLEKALDFYKDFAFIAVGLIATHDSIKAHSFSKFIGKGNNDVETDKK